MEEYERCCRIWKNWSRSAPQEITSRLGHYYMLQAYHSTKIEYPELSFNTVSAVWSEGKLAAYTGNIYPVIALNNHRVAYALVDACMKGNESLSVDLICGIQHALSCGLYTPQDYVLKEDRPGEFKQSDSVSGVWDAGASPEEIEEVLMKLVGEMPYIADRNDTLVAAAYLHARIIFIRPFAVSNGETARMICNYWLRQQGHPPVLFQSGDIQRYKKCLEEFDIHEDIEPLALFMSEKVVEFWKPQMSQASQPAKGSIFTLKT